MSTASYRPRDNVAFQGDGRLQVAAAETEILAVSAKDRFRHLAARLPTAADAILEIGCSTGAATRSLAASGARVVAVDKSQTLVADLQERLADPPRVTVHCADGRNIPALARLLPAPTLIYLDIGGDAHLDVVALQLRLCLRAFRPRALVVRSFELATLASLVSVVEPPDLSPLLPMDGPAGVEPLDNLLELGQSTSTDVRCFAARRLGRVDSEAARDGLRQMRDDPHPKVRRAAARALREPD